MAVVPVDMYNKLSLNAPPCIQPTIVAAQSSSMHQMYMVPMVTPVMNPNMYLITIIQNLYQVFPSNTQVLKQLRRSLELLYKG
jgi:hypothetical protein